MQAIVVGEAAVIILDFLMHVAKLYQHGAFGHHFLRESWENVVYRERLLLISVCASGFVDFMNVIKKEKEN